MDPPSYILDPRWETIGCSVKIEQGPTGWVDGPVLGTYLNDLKSWSRSEGRPIRMISHNMLFDGAVLSWRYGFVADQMVDTLALSRALLGYILRRHTLDAVARFLGVGAKGTTIVKVNGMRRADIINAGLWGEYCAYSILDADLCRGIYDRLMPVMPWSEIELYDMVHRMAVIPKLELDVALLCEHLAEVQAEKAALLSQAGCTVADLMSNERLAAALIAMGITPPTKVSPSDETKETWAFAKTDHEFTDLLEHPDPAVQTIVAARLGHKSTLEESRTERLINIARLNFPCYGTGLLPVALKPSGAHTFRLSGDWRLNLQNVPRPSLRRPVPKIRKSIRTPRGYKLLVADSRQIEARLTLTFCGQWDGVAEFERGEDVYCNTATKVFGRKITKADFGPRFCGKLLKLSGIYQTGWRKYRHTLAHNSREQTGTPILIDEFEARAQVDAFRADHAAVTAMWKYIQWTVIPAMTNPQCDFMVGPVRVMFEAVVLPNGMVIHYHSLHVDPDTNNWIFTYGGRIKKLYAGKWLENVIQALARIVVMDAALVLRDMMAAIGAFLVLQSHDELGYLVPDEYIEYAEQTLTWAMKLRPQWMPRCPIDTELGDPSTNYAEAKQ